MAETIQTYQQRVAIGSLGKDGQVYASEALIRYLRQGFTRMGGSEAMTNAELGDAVGAFALEPVEQQHVAAMGLDVSPPLQVFQAFIDPLVPAAIQMPPPDDLSRDARIASLEALVARMAVQINDLQQGYQL